MPDAYSNSHSICSVLLPNVQVSDTIGDDHSTIASYIIALF